MTEGPVIDVPACPRCGRRHEALTFVPLSGSAVYCGPFETMTHWAKCPMTGDPVLLGKQSLPEYATDVTR